MTDEEVRAVAPGRVVLIGDHTDYVGGLVLPMAIDLSTEVRGRRTGGHVELSSAQLDGVARFEVPVTDPTSVTPGWARYVAGVAAVIGARTGLVGTVDSSVPPGGGLSSSAALELAVALALGAPEDDPVELARRCRSAEETATGVPCGIMDQLCCAAGVEGHALLIDCSTETHRTVPVPEELEVWVVDSGQPRQLSESPYAERRREAEAAAALLGHLPDVPLEAIEELPDDRLRRRARHVRTECDRVERLAAALDRGDLDEVGALLSASHRSLRDDAEVSTPVLDALVADVEARPGVLGARLTGAGFGGSVVVLARSGARLDDVGAGARRVRPSAGARTS